jgi:DNA-binding NtrC family response regulator
MSNLLVVDDDSDMALLLADLLGLSGHTVRVANNGREGLEAMRASAPDLVVVDVEMPTLTGPEMALEMFLRDRGLEKIPVILCSGVLDLDRVAAWVGTHYFMSKPYDPGVLLELIERALVEHIPPHPPALERP